MSQHNEDKSPLPVYNNSLLCGALCGNGSIVSRQYISTGQLATQSFQNFPLVSNVFTNKLNIIIHYVF